MWLRAERHVSPRELDRQDPPVAVPRARRAAPRAGYLAIGAIVVATATAGAQAPVATRDRPSRPPPFEPAPAQPPPEPTAEDVASAPRPRQTSGRIDPGEGGDSLGRLAARAVLALPLLAFQIVTLPVRGAVYAYDRYEVRRHWYETLYSRDRSRALLPVLTYQTSDGLTAGVRYVDINLADQNEHLVLQATGGSVYRVGVNGAIDTGDRMGPVRLELGGNFDRFPAEPFYGFGNGDGDSNGRSEPLPMLVDPATDPTAIHTHARYQEIGGSAYADWRIVANLHAGARASMTDVEIGPSSRRSPSIEMAYTPTSLVGFGDSVQHAYGELSLSWDSRHQRSRWEPLSVHGAGSLATVFGGLARNVRGEGGDFARYGGELQHYLHLGFGPRVLIARLHAEGVTGSLDELPFTELPSLGGDAFLRGYPHGRFRDRLAGVASLQYMWNLSMYSEAFVFVDAGRVYREYSDLTFEDLRVGFGFGVELHTQNSFLIDAHIASSRDGGVILTAAFSPVLDSRPRWR
jgi:hypothetical protein